LGKPLLPKTLYWNSMRSKSVIQRYFCMIIILIYHDCDFKKMRIQINRVEKYRWIFLWTTRHKGKWFFFNISLSNVNFYGMFYASSKFEWCGIEEVGSGSFSYEKKDKIYKQVIFQHECIVSPVQSASCKALHCAWHFHQRNSSVLSYVIKINFITEDTNVFFLYWETA
jgi:hypothetical protein